MRTIIHFIIGSSLAWIIAVAGCATRQTTAIVQPNPMDTLCALLKSNTISKVHVFRLPNNTGYPVNRKVIDGFIADPAFTERIRNRGAGYKRGVDKLIALTGNDVQRLNACLDSGNAYELPPYYGYKLYWKAAFMNDSGKEQFVVYGSERWEMVCVGEQSVILERSPRNWFLKAIKD